jgi:hypothetical protein
MNGLVAWIAIHAKPQEKDNIIDLSSPISLETNKKALNLLKVIC